MNIRSVFMGSPAFAVPILESLIDHVQIVGVVTQPDRPAGRGKVLTPPPVKILAESRGLPVIQPEKLKDPNVKEQLIDWEPDLIIVAAFGQILRKWLLDLPRYGCINVHGSLLPRWRGASPIQAAILSGDECTGISIMKMDEGIDTGGILSKKSLQILEDDTTASLSERLAVLGAQLLLDTLPGYLSGEVVPTPQTEEGACYAGMISANDAILDLARPAKELERQVRAYQPWPVAKLSLDGQIISVLAAESIPQNDQLHGDRIVWNKFPAIRTADGYLVLKMLQPAGKKGMSGRDFVNGYKNWLA